jgi:chemotaxis protein methyltransferase CheR
MTAKKDKKKMLSTQDSLSKHSIYQLPDLSKHEFNLIRKIIGDYCGIRIPDTKVVLLKNRVGKRLRALGMNSYKKYYNYLKTTKGRSKEYVHLWEAITTNQTHFFREQHHFDVLVQHVLPTLLKKPSNIKKINIWCAGCSTGQEAYSLAATVSDFVQNKPQWSYNILASDIDYKVLQVAEKGIYPAELKKEIPNRVLIRHFRSDKKKIRVRDQLKKHINFRYQNFKELDVRRPRFDIIFCRNVIMYFHEDFRRELMKVFSQNLFPQGYLFLGSTESLQGATGLFEMIKHGKTIVYRKTSRQED